MCVATFNGTCAAQAVRRRAHAERRSRRRVRARGEQIQNSRASTAITNTSARPVPSTPSPGRWSNSSGQPFCLAGLFISQTIYACSTDKRRNCCLNIPITLIDKYSGFLGHRRIPWRCGRLCADRVHWDGVPSESSPRFFFVIQIAMSNRLARHNVCLGCQTDSIGGRLPILGQEHVHLSEASARPQLGGYEMGAPPVGAGVRR